jgi:hypothetical protein
MALQQQIILCGFNYGYRLLLAKQVPFFDLFDIMTSRYHPRAPLISGAPSVRHLAVLKTTLLMGAL